MSILTKLQMVKALNEKPVGVAGDSLAAVGVREFARLVGIVNYLQVCLALSMESRAILDALIFLGDGDEERWIEISNLELAYYIRCEQRLVKDKTLKGMRDNEGKFLTVGGRRITESGLEKWVGRRRKVLFEEQQRAGVWLIEFQGGGHKLGKNEKAKYRVVCYSMISGVQELLQRSAGIESGNVQWVESEIWKAVLAVLESERQAVRRPNVGTKFKRPRVTPDSRANMAIAHARAAFDMAFNDVAEFERIADKIFNGLAELYRQGAEMKGILPYSVKRAEVQEAAAKMFGHGDRPKAA